MKKRLKKKQVNTNAENSTWDELYALYKGHYEDQARKVRLGGYEPLEEMYTKYEFVHEFKAIKEAAESEGKSIEGQYRSVVASMAYGNVQKYKESAVKHYVKMAKEQGIDLDINEVRMHGVQENGLGQLAKEMNWQLKMDGVSDSYQRAHIIAQQIFGSD